MVYYTQSRRAAKAVRLRGGRKREKEGGTRWRKEEKTHRKL